MNDRDDEVTWDDVRSEAAIAGVPDLVGRVAGAVYRVGRSPLGEVEVALAMRAASWVEAAASERSVRQASMLWRAAGVLQSLALADRAACGPARTALREWAWQTSRTVGLLADVAAGSPRPTFPAGDTDRGVVGMVEAIERDAVRVVVDGR